MAIPLADKLVAKAKQGVKLNHVERRHCVAYLMATEPDQSNVALGVLFQVSEKMIRNDKLCVREERAQLIKEDDIALVIADIALNFDRQIRDIEKSKQKAGPGSRTYLEHCKSIFKMELEKVTALQGLGFYPKNLGTLTTNKFEYSASVTVMGEETQTKLAATDEDRNAGALDAEFSDVEITPLKLIDPPTLPS
jgi:hypothetical protein